MPHVKDLYDDLLDSPASTKSSSVLVSNVQPVVNDQPYRIAIIGEAPGSNEVEQGRPFVGYSGQRLDAFLSRFNILRDACFVGNVCQQQPNGNHIANFDWDGPEITSGIAKLRDDLAKFKPNICLLLGGSALHAFRNPDIIPKKRKTKEGYSFVFPDSIGDWRGSLFLSHPNAPYPMAKCIAAYHPAACLRNFSWMPLLALDIHKAREEASTPTLELPIRNLCTTLSFEETLNELEKLTREKPLISIDIEGGIQSMSCISIAPSPTYSFIVPFALKGGGSFYTNPDQEVLIWKALTRVLGDPLIPKVLQNSLYDRFVLQYSYGIIVRGVKDDTMLGSWELHSEFEKSLGMLCSLYTKEPFYKEDRLSEDQDTFYKYCCRDSAVTYEINAKLNKWLRGTSMQHYQFNMDLLNPLLYMELRGIRYDKPLAKQRLKEVKRQIYELQFDLDQTAGFGVDPKSTKERLRHLLRSTMCFKKDPSRPKKGYEEAFDLNMRVLLGTGDLTKAELGRLSTDLDLSLNVKGKPFKTYLYEKLKLPVQRDPKTDAITTDYEALLTLSKKTDHPSLPLAIAIGEMRTRSQMLEIETDPDGRVRCGYNEVGSETGRVTCYTSPTGSGYALQTIPDADPLRPENHPLRQGMRDLLLADEGCYLCKCDLKGADGWTVGANLAALGATAMLDDLLFGIKPAARLCYMMRHGPHSLNGKQRDEVKNLLKEVKKDDWDYFAYKQWIWGFCYGLGAKKAVNLCFTVSQGTVRMEEKTAEQAKYALFDFYHVPLWHRAMERKLFNQPYPPKLPSPSGHIREFFGRKQEILGEALAHEPQSVTTYATNRAVHNSWTDPENRLAGQFPPLRVEPIHQVHDEFLTQFKIVDTEWAVDKIKSWFNNSMFIAGIKVTIPFDMSYGINWSMDENAKRGPKE